MACSGGLRQLICQEERAIHDGLQGTRFQSLVNIILPSLQAFRDQSPFLWSEPHKAILWACRGRNPEHWESLAKRPLICTHVSWRGIFRRREFLNVPPIEKPRNFTYQPNSLVLWIPVPRLREDKLYRDNDEEWEVKREKIKKQRRIKGDLVFTRSSQARISSSVFRLSILPYPVS